LFYLTVKSNTMGYFLLILTIISETAAIILMKLANGFQHKLYSAAAIVAYALGFVFLTLALKQLPVGLANAIWAGASTVLVAVIGWIFFKEQLSTVQIISVLLIVVGLIGLRVQ
jgi:small multidrug resistance pump